ncbi:hypothetical protein EV182_006711 [Spiromyces aspiralis]|uniref:Uncharacterized protein n=1 Tax=Spiromyces aspiralis TaxID=68401 RepID=A0ACC1H8E6_9FUNG|nr:hypothetical protein EV182_006711 [Spiromyces aspiralis]
MTETIAKLQRELEQHKTKVDMLESEVRRAQEQYVELELRHNEAQETESDLRDKLDERNGTIKKLKDEVARHQKREEQTENEVAVLREQFQKMSEQYTKERDVWRMEVEKYRKEAGKAYKRGEGDAWKKWKVVEELVSITRDELKESLVEMVNGVMSLEKGMRSVRDVVMFSRSFGNIWEDLEVGGESNPDQAMGSEEEGDSGEQDGDESAATNGRFVGKPPSVTTPNEDSADSDAKSAGGEDEETSMGSRVATSLSTSTTSHQPSNRSWIDND